MQFRKAPDNPDLFEAPPSGSRILLFVPHPDDEIAACYKIIKYAIDMKLDILVVIVTNGDGIGAIDLRNKVFRRAPEYFIRTGNIRREEAIRVLTGIGLSKENIIFLGYPDRHILKLWTENWDENRPLKSRSTLADASCYTGTYSLGTPYTGTNLQKTIEQIIVGFAPTYVFFPDYNDNHVDHMALSFFVKYTLYKIDYKFFEYTYLVHKGLWPFPPCKMKRLELHPPRCLRKVPMKWYSIYLSREEIEEKLQSLLLYKSQLSNFILRNYLFSFIRKNEILCKYDKTENVVYLCRDDLYKSNSMVLNLDLPAFPFRRSQIVRIDVDHDENKNLHLNMDIQKTILANVCIMRYTFLTGSGNTTYKVENGKLEVIIPQIYLKETPVIFICCLVYKNRKVIGRALPIIIDMRK